MACNTRGEAWLQKVNADAIDDLVKNQGVHVLPLPNSVVDALRAANEKILDEAIAKDPVTKKVADSYAQISVDLPAVGEIQREALLRPRARRLT